MNDCGDETGLLWADPKVSARNLVRGTFNPALESPLAIAIEETLAERARLHREKAKLLARLDALAREQELIDRRLARQQEALRTYEKNGVLPDNLIPDCEAAIAAEVARNRRKVHKAVSEDVAALCEVTRPAGWEFAGKRTDGDFLYVKLKKRIAAAVEAITPAALRRRVVQAVQRFCSSVSDRREVVAAARRLVAFNPRPLQPAPP